MYEAADVKQIEMLAQNKADAYDKATYEYIPETEGSVPYSSWVAGYRKNHGIGEVHWFNTFEGKAY